MDRETAFFFWQKWLDVFRIRKNIQRINIGDILT